MTYSQSTETPRCHIGHSPDLPQPQVWLLYELHTKLMLENPHPEELAMHVREKIHSCVIL